MNVKRGTWAFMVLALCFMSMQSLVAQEIEVAAPSEVLENETFQIQYSIYSGAVIEKMPKLLDAKDYQLLKEPQMKRAYPSPFWGRNYHTLQIIYTFKPNKTGKLKRPRIEVIADEQKIVSEDGFIQVAEMPEMGKVDCFVKLSATKTYVSEGDTLSLTYKLYSTKEISKVINIKAPGSRSFYYQNITPRDADFTEERIDGVDYKVYVIAKYTLQARSLGTIEIPEGEVHVEYTYPTGRTRTDDWGRAYDEQLREVKTCVIEPITIRVHNMTVI